MADDRDSLLREVEEELRREKLQKIWDQYSLYILGAAALLIVGVIGFKQWQSSKLTAAEAAGAEYLTAVQLIDEKKTDEATKAFEKIAASGPSGYSQLAKLQLAATQVKAGKTAEALATFDSLGKDSGADPLLKSFAQLQAAALRLSDGDFSEMQNRLTPLIADDGAYRTSAQELLGIAALKAKNFDEARKQLEPLLIDPNASRAIQDRVKIALASIAAGETGSSATPSAAPAQTPAATPDKPAAAGETEKK